MCTPTENCVAVCLYKFFKKRCYCRSTPLKSHLVGERVTIEEQQQQQQQRRRRRRQTKFTTGANNLWISSIRLKFQAFWCAFTFSSASAHTHSTLPVTCVTFCGSRKKHNFNGSFGKIAISHLIYNNNIIQYTIHI